MPLFSFSVSVSVSVKVSCQTTDARGQRLGSVILSFCGSLRVESLTDLRIAPTACVKSSIVCVFVLLLALSGSLLLILIL